MSDADGPKFEGAWLACLLSASYKADEALVRIVHTGSTEPPAFYVGLDLVKPEPPMNDEIAGMVRVTLLNRENGTSVVEVPGEPVSYGPRIQVPTALLT
jgi:hypothetical protein